MWNVELGSRVGAAPWALAMLLAACGGGTAVGPGPMAGVEKPPPAAGPSAEAQAKQKFEQAAA